MRETKDRRAVPACVLVVGTSLAAVLLSAAGAAWGQAFERIHRYDVAIRIEADGSLVVSETIDYDFGSSSRHGIFRDIPVRFRYDDRFDRIYPLDVLSVEASPGTPAGYEVEKEGSLLRIRIGDPDRTITGLHTYHISYRVEGALNGFSSHDELYWNAIGNQWGAPIDSASATVTAPAAISRVACFAGPFGSTLPCSGSDFQGHEATFRQSTLSPFEALTVVVALPKGAVTPPRPMLVERWSLSRAFSITPLSLGLTLGSLLLVVLGVGRLLWVQGRDRRALGSPVDIAFATSPDAGQPVPLFERGATPVEYAPPDGIRPGQVGTLVDEVANPLDVTATIVDLGVRGYLRIEEIAKRWVLGKPDWRLVKLKEPDGRLLRYERILFDGLFEDPDEEESEDQDEGWAEAAPPRPDLIPGSDARSEGLARVKLSSLRKRFSDRLKRVQTPCTRTR